MNKPSEPLDGVQKNTFKRFVCPIIVNFQSTKAKHCIYLQQKALYLRGRVSKHESCCEPQIKSNIGEHLPPINQ